MNALERLLHAELAARYSKNPTMKQISADRYHRLMACEIEELSEQERADGWHFCPDWDFLLIHPTWPEWSGCECNILI